MPRQSDPHVFEGYTKAKSILRRDNLGVVKLREQKFCVCLYNNGCGE